MVQPNVYVAPIHFEDFSGEAFERLTFAYHLRAECWHQLEWYGQVGTDLGRDIWASRENDFGQMNTMCIQCVNRGRLTKAKALSDFEKILRGPSGKPDSVRFVCRADVSATLRDTLKNFAHENSIDEVDIWSGQEFEERLRSHAESLLQRFCEGVVFPDSSRDLGVFVHDLPVLNDGEIIRRLAVAFDRPAFTTPFYAESSLGNFKQALADTIEVMNTGICKTRDGIVFSKIHSRHAIQDASIKQKLATIAKLLNKLRIDFDNLERSGEIEQCKSGSHVHLTQSAIHIMDTGRRKILELFREVYPEFAVQLY